MAMPAPNAFALPGSQPPVPTIMAAPQRPSQVPFLDAAPATPASPAVVPIGAAVACAVVRRKRQLRARKLPVATSLAWHPSFDTPQAVLPSPPLRVSLPTPHVKPVSVRLAEWWNRGKLDLAELRKKGLSALLCWGFVSHVSMVLCMHVAVASTMVATKTSPFVDKAALAHFGIGYAGLLVLNSILVPLRIGITVACVPLHDAAVRRFEKDLHVKTRTAVVMTVVLENIVILMAILVAGMFLVSLACGVPLGGFRIGELVRAGKAVTHGAV